MILFGRAYENGVTKPVPYRVDRSKPINLFTYPMQIPVVDIATNQSYTIISDCLFLSNSLGQEYNLTAVIKRSKNRNTTRQEDSDKKGT